MHPDTRWFLQQLAIAGPLMALVTWIAVSLALPLPHALPPCDEQISRCVR